VLARVYLVQIEQVFDICRQKNYRLEAQKFKKFGQQMPGQSMRDLKQRYQIQKAENGFDNHYEVSCPLATVKSVSLSEEGPVLDYIFQVGTLEYLPVLCLTNKDQSKLINLPKLQSYMKLLIEPNM
jgi:hypothetical protein